jgi:hypothetical protein
VHALTTLAIVATALLALVSLSLATVKRAGGLASAKRRLSMQPARVPVSRRAQRRYDAEVLDTLPSRAPPIRHTRDRGSRSGPDSPGRD